MGPVAPQHSGTYAVSHLAQRASVALANHHAVMPWKPARTGSFCLRVVITRYDRIQVKSSPEKNYLSELAVSLTLQMDTSIYLLGQPCHDNNSTEPIPTRISDPQYHEDYAED